MSKQVAVIGAGLGGLSAAIHARLRGYDVLVLERAAIPGGKAAGIEQGGYRLDPGPSIVILTRIYRDLFSAAGRRMEDYLRFRRLDPWSRVLWEGHPPIDLPADEAECLRLVREIAPADADAFDTLLRKLDKVSPLIDRSIFSHPYEKPHQLADPRLIGTALHFDVRATYRELVDRTFQSPVLRAFFYGFPSYGGQTYDSKAPGALMIPYLMIREGVWWPEGGVAAIPKALERLARELGVEFRFGCDVVGMNAEGGRVRSLRLADGEAVPVEKVISNVDRLTTRAWLGHRVDWRPSLSYFTVHWGVRRRLEGLSHHTLIVPRDFERGFEQLYRERVFPDQPIVYLNVTSDTEPDTAPPGATNLFAVITAPGDEPQLQWTEREREYVRRTREAMAAAGVCFDDDEIELERVQTPVYFAERHGNYRGSLYGPDEAHRLWGLFPMRNRDEEYRNLFYCGGSVQPGAGMPMVVLSGKFAASALG